MSTVKRFNVNREQVSLDADIIENMSANDVSYDDSFQYDENTVGDKLSELESKVIYDVSSHNNGVTFTSLSALLSSENLSTLIPIAVRCGGMSIRFVNSSDNKYVQYRLTNQSWSVDIDDWQEIDSAKFSTGKKVSETGIDDEPTSGSDNLVKSGGVAKELENISNSNCVDEDEEILITSNDETETLVKVNSEGVEVKSLSVPEKIINNIIEDANDRISITDDEENEEVCGITKKGVYVKKIFYKNGEIYVDISPYFEKSELSTMNIPYIFYVVNPSVYLREYVVRVFAESYLNEQPKSPVYLNNRRDCAISLKSKLGNDTVKNGSFNHTITLSAEGYNKKTITQNVKWVSEKAFDNCKVRLLLFGVSFDAIDYLDDEGKEIEAGGWLTASIEKFLRMGEVDRGVQRNYVSIGTAGIRLENWKTPSEKYPFKYKDTTLYSGGRHEARGANCGVNYLRQPFDFRPTNIDYDANVGDGNGSVMWDMNGLRHRVPYNVEYEPTEDYGDFEITEAKLTALRCTPFGKYHHDYTEGLWEHCNTKGWIKNVGGTYSAWTGSSTQKEIVDLCMAYAAENPRYGWYDIDTARDTSYINGQPKDVNDNTQYALNINKYLERYRTMDEEGVKLVCEDTNPSGKSIVGSDGNTYTIGTNIKSQALLINCNVCTPTHVIWDMCFNDAGFYLSSDTTGVGGSDSVAMAELFAQAIHSQLGNNIKVGFKSKKVNGSFYPEIWEDIALSQQYNIANRYANGLMRYNEAMMEAHSNLSHNINWIPCFPVTIPFGSRYLQKFDDFVYDNTLVASCDSFVEGRTDFTHDGIRTTLAMALQIYGWIGYTLL